MSSREAGRQRVETLVERFRANYTDYTRPSSLYNETHLRTDFLNDLLESLGWDVQNKKNAPDVQKARLYTAGWR
ncbi:MAG: hypothetical protein NT023_21765 [Armatimonadetes bacterium]|nr:hypothetical protein [Armatimonadota bacterium]